MWAKLLRLNDVCQGFGRDASWIAEDGDDIRRRRFEAECLAEDVELLANIVDGLWACTKKQSDNLDPNEDSLSALAQTRAASSNATI
jgi:hypothetical protein